MSDITPTPPPPAPVPTLPGAAPRAPGRDRWVWLLVLALSLVATGIGWSARQRIDHLEAELVKRQEASRDDAAEARMLARAAEQQARDAAARAALLETRLAEVALQRSQVEELVRSMTRSRDENLLVDIEAGLRVAIQQSTLTGSAEPVVNALQSADERLARAQQPRLDPIRRAVTQDLDRVRATRLSDLASLAIRLDEAIRLLDEVPLLAPIEQPGTSASTGRRADHPGRQTGPAAAPDEAVHDTDWLSRLKRWGQDAGQAAWVEARSLIRLTRINQPEAMLLAPDQGYFLRENLKLRLLNARLSLLSRQTPTAISDLQAAQGALQRYFDTSSRKTQLAQKLLADVIDQAPRTQVPRPDGTLALLATLNGGR